MRESAKNEDQLSENEIRCIFQSLDALIYVSDLDTHELIFVNKALQSKFGEPLGKKCWQYLQQDQVGPCNFCTNSLIAPGNKPSLDPVVWEFRNTRDNRWYQCRDIATVWPDGRLVRIEIAIDITAQKDLEEKLRVSKKAAQRLALQDELTHLPNRRSFLAECDNVLTSSGYNAPFSLVMIDLDSFKAVNDTYGHPAGDHVLHAAAQRLKSLTRSSDIICRFGGEEFALAVPGASTDEALLLADRLRKNLKSSPINYKDFSITVTASFGISGTNGQEASSLSRLLREADIAMYQAKRNGRDRVEVYSSNEV